MSYRSKGSLLVFLFEFVFLEPFSQTDYLVLGCNSGCCTLIWEQKQRLASHCHLIKINTNMQNKMEQKGNLSIVWHVCIYSLSPSSVQEDLTSLVGSLDNPSGGPVSTETQLPPVWLVQEETNQTRQSSLFWNADWKVSKAGFYRGSVALRRNHCRKSLK